MRTEYIVPKEGMRIMNPTTRSILTPKPKRVAWNSYWSRRLQDGGIEIVKKPITEAVPVVPEAEPKTKTETPSKKK